MLLAVHALSATAQTICYGIAVAAFLLAAVGSFGSRATPPSMALVGLGLAAFAFPSFWNQLALS